MLVSGFWSLVSGFWFLVSGFRILLSCFGFRDFCFKFQVSGFWFLVTDFGILVLELLVCDFWLRGLHRADGICVLVLLRNFPDLEGRGGDIDIKNQRLGLLATSQVHLDRIALST